MHRKRAHYIHIVPERTEQPFVATYGAVTDQRNCCEHVRLHSPAANNLANERLTDPPIVEERFFLTSSPAVVVEQ